MMNKLIKANIEVKASPIHGFGVFAAKAISKKEIIEECPAMVFPKLKEYSKNIDERVFFWDEHEHAIALGYGSLYNHSDKPNATYSIDRENKIIKFIATDDIKSGSEILVDYGKDWFAGRYYSALKAKRKYDFRLYRAVGIIFILLILSIFLKPQIHSAPARASAPQQPYSAHFGNWSKVQYK